MIQNLTCYVTFNWPPNEVKRIDRPGQWDLLCEFTVQKMFSRCPQAQNHQLDCTSLLEGL